MSKLLIVGGVAAGMSAAAKARRVNPDLEIGVYTEEDYISYSGCGLPYFIGNKVNSEERLLARSIQEFQQENITVHTGYRVMEIKAADKILRIRNILTGEDLLASYDQLIIATGARPFVQQAEEQKLKGVFVLRNITDSLAIRDYFTFEKPRRAVIIGGGYVGLEMLENLLEFECSVTVLEKNEHIIPNMDEDMAEILSEYLHSKGVTIRTGVNVLGFNGKRKVRQILTDQGIIPADFVLVAIGVVPNSELAAAAGIELGARNAIRVNSKMETSIAGIYAAGDCATTHHLVSGQEVYLPLGTTANKQGKVAGENAAGGAAEFKGVLGTGIAQVMDMEMSRTGLTEKECDKLKIKYETHLIKAKTAANYYPDAGDMYVKLLSEKESRRLIGGQIMGYTGAAKRIDMLAVAIALKASVDDLVDIDLSYAPPFSTVWDPVLIALNQF